MRRAECRASSFRDLVMGPRGVRAERAAAGGRAVIGWDASGAQRAEEGPCVVGCGAEMCQRKNKAKLTWEREHGR